MNFAETFADASTATASCVLNSGGSGVGVGGKSRAARAIERVGEVDVVRITATTECNSVLQIFSFRGDCEHWMATNVITASL